jgi:hypothetical protein
VVEAASSSLVTQTNKREENERFSSLFCCFLYFLKAKATYGATVVQKSVQNNQKYLLRNGRGHSTKMVDFFEKNYTLKEQLWQAFHKNQMAHILSESVVAKMILEDLSIVQRFSNLLNPILVFKS